MGKDLDVGMKCIKYMLFITNFMFVMIGFLLISVGSTITAIYNDFEMFMEDHYFSPAALFIAIGVIIFFVALLGCLGAIKESTCLVNMYAVFLFFVFILEIAAIISAFAMRNNISAYVEARMFDLMAYYDEDNSARESWDFLQSRLGCCGVHDPNDWNAVRNGSIVNDFNSTIPDSCFRSENLIFQAGCLNQLYYIISESALLIGTGAICVAIVQVLGVIFARMLAKSIRRIKTEEERKRQENRQRLYAQMARANDEKPTPVLYTAEEHQA